MSETMTFSTPYPFTVLEARERRAAFQYQILLEHPGQTLVTVKANYPGGWKHSPYTTVAVSVLTEKAQELMQPTYTAWTNTCEGCIAFFLTSLPGKQAKQIAVSLEDNHDMGRLVDIDVLDQQKMYSRTEQGFEARRCYLCQEPAHACGRSQKHSRGEIDRFFQDKVTVWARKNDSHAILFSLIAEASSFPKFGLVTPFSQGSHSDMDFILFLKSAHVIAPLIAQAVTESLIEPDMMRQFKKLRSCGKAIEEQMLSVTNGVNTHKGAIFIFLIVLLGMKLGTPTASLPDTIRTLASPLENDFEDIRARAAGAGHLTHGEKVFMEYGFGGVRSLALSGFKEVFTDYLPFLQAARNQGGDLNLALVRTLLHVMGSCPDTTVIHRGGMEGWRWMQDNARKVVQGIKSVDVFNEECIDRKISPGGCADILALLVFLDTMSQT